MSARSPVTIDYIDENGRVQTLSFRDRVAFGVWAQLQARLHGNFRVLQPDAPKPARIRKKS